MKLDLGKSEEMPRQRDRNVNTAGNVNNKLDWKKNKPKESISYFL